MTEPVGRRETDRKACCVVPAASREVRRCQPTCPPTSQLCPGLGVNAAEIANVSPRRDRFFFFHLSPTVNADDAISAGDVLPQAMARQTINTQTASGMTNVWGVAP